MTRKNDIETTKNFKKGYKTFLERLAKIPYDVPEYYVYYDGSGALTLVTPNKDETRTESYLKVNYWDIRNIVIGKEPMRKYFVEDGELFSKEYLKEKYGQYLYSEEDSFVDRVEPKNDTDIVFEASNHRIRVLISSKPLEVFRNLLKERLVEEQNLNISGSKYFTFFVADETDPNLLVDSFDIPVRDLVSNGYVDFQGEYDWDEMAIYCKQNVTTGMVMENDK